MRINGHAVSPPLDGSSVELKGIDDIIDETITDDETSSEASKISKIIKRKPFNVNKLKRINKRKFNNNNNNNNNNNSNSNDTEDEDEDENESSDCSDDLGVVQKLKWKRITINIDENDNVITDNEDGNECELSNKDDYYDYTPDNSDEDDNEDEDEDDSSEEYNTKICPLDEEYEVGWEYHIDDENEETKGYNNKDEIEKGEIENNKDNNKEKKDEKHIKKYRKEKKIKMKNNIYQMAARFETNRHHFKNKNKNKNKHKNYFNSEISYSCVGGSNATSYNATRGNVFGEIPNIDVNVNIKNNKRLSKDRFSPFSMDNNNNNNNKNDNGNRNYYGTGGGSRKIKLERSVKAVDSGCEKMKMEINMKMKDENIDKFGKIVGVNEKTSKK